MIKYRFFRFIVGLDQALNPLVYGGSEDVTLSSQTAFNELFLKKDHRKRKFIDWLFRLIGQKKHCYWSLLAEANQFPAERDEIVRVLAEHGVSV